MTGAGLRRRGRPAHPRRGRPRRDHRPARGVGRARPRDHGRRHLVPAVRPRRGGSGPRRPARRAGDRARDRDGDRLRLSAREHAPDGPARGRLVRVAVRVAPGRRPRWRRRCRAVRSRGQWRARIRTPSCDAGRAPGRSGSRCSPSWARPGSCCRWSPSDASASCTPRSSGSPSRVSSSGWAPSRSRSARIGPAPRCTWEPASSPRRPACGSRIGMARSRPAPPSPIRRPAPNRRPAGVAGSRWPSPSAPWRCCCRRSSRSASRCSPTMRPPPGPP